MSPEDKGLAVEIATGVLRRRLWLDACLAPHVRGGLEKLDPIVRDVLRIGAYQLVGLDRIPAHAAVSTTVDLAKSKRRFAAGLVNAVLRKVASAPARSAPDDFQGLAVYASVPQWIADELQLTFDALSKEQDPHRTLLGPSSTVSDVLLALAKPAHPMLRVLENRIAQKTLVETLKSKGINASPCRFSTVGVGIERAGELTSLPGFGSDFIAQDEAAQLVCELARDEKGPTLDGCAAPGGKTLALWSMGHEALTSVDVHENRVRLLRATLSSAKVSGTVMHASMEAPPFPAESFNTVLLDAPCTGSGTLRRHPDLRWSLKPDDVGRMSALQSSILAGSARLVRPGGCLIYAVCSFLAAEGTEVIEAFVRENKDFGVDTWLTTAPHMDVMDGFYAAKLRRRATPDLAA